MAKKLLHRNKIFGTPFAIQSIKKGGFMGINQARWIQVFNEAQGLAEIANQLTKELRHERSKNIWGRPEWEYEDRVWFRKVLPMIGGAPGIAFQTRLARFAVEARSFLADMKALKQTPRYCETRGGDYIFYDDAKIPSSWGVSWQLFLVHYEMTRKALSKADLECASDDCDPIDEVTLPFLPEIVPYWSGVVCPRKTRSIFDDFD